MIDRFPGRHYETGTIANALLAMGAKDPTTNAPYSEALALGASGGIAFGYFVFEYTGHLPHVALLTRNTISPVERALDNLAIRRETRETTDAAKGEENLRRELDMGNPVIVWADVFSMPYRGLDPTQMWMMQPILVVGATPNGFLVIDGQERPVEVAADILGKARARVKKDRFRIMTIEPPDTERLSEGLLQGMRTCAALFLDKPPVGSANNWGVAGMRFWAKMLRETRNAKSWARQFAPGPNLTQALAGRPGQPGVWDWIETWGTSGSSDRRTYAQFLREAAEWTKRSELRAVADGFDETAVLWSELAEAAMPDFVPALRRLKELKRRYSEAWITEGLAAVPERDRIRRENLDAVQELGDAEVLAPHFEGIRIRMAELVEGIADAEEAAALSLRSAIG